jgi:hypothetical protein
MLSYLTSIYGKKLDVDVAPIFVARFLDTAYVKRDKDGNVIGDATAAWPWPSSRFDKPPYSTKETNDVPEYRDSVGWFFVNMWNASTLGLRWSVVNSAIKKLEDKQQGMKSLSDEEKKAIAEFTKRDAQTLEDNPNIRANVKAWMTGFRTVQVNKLRTAVKFLKVRNLIETTLPLVGWRFTDMDADDATLSTMKKPIQLVKLPSRDPYDAMSLGDFTKLAIAKAVAKRGDAAKTTPRDLLNTLPKKGANNNKDEKKDDKEGLNIPTNPNVKQAYMELVGLQNFWENEANVEKLASLFDDEDSDDKIEELFAFHASFSSFVSDFDKRHKEIVARKRAKRQEGKKDAA